MNNKFTRSGMAHLNPFRKKKNEKPEVKQVPIRREPYALPADFDWNWNGIHRQANRDADLRREQVRRGSALSYQDWSRIRAHFEGTSPSNNTNPCAEIGLNENSPPKEIKPHIVRTKDPVGYQHTRGFTANHQHVRYQYDKGTNEQDKGYGQLSISDSIGGCGMQQLYSWTATSSEEIATMLVNSMLGDIHYHTGVILCQVGMNYYGHPMVRALEKAGFTISLEYINYTHGLNGKYTQRVYQYVVPDKSEEEEEYDEDEEYKED